MNRTPKQQKTTKKQATRTIRPTTTKRKIATKVKKPTRNITTSFSQSTQSFTSPLFSNTTTTTTKRSYHANVIDHYEKPRNVGSLDAKSDEVGTGLVGAPACGDVMKLQVKIKDGVVEDVKFRTFGCGSAIASSSYATTWLKGKTIEEALAIKNTDIANHLSLPPVKMHCSMLAEDAVKAAIQDYQIKQTSKSQQLNAV